MLGDLIFRVILGHVVTAHALSPLDFNVPPYSSTTEMPLTSSIIHNTLLSKLKKYNAPTVCLNGSDLVYHTVANVLGSVCSFPPGKYLAAVCPRGPDSVDPLSFKVLIDDLRLRAACEVHKFVDDTTFSELIPSTGSVSNMQTI